MIENKYPFVNCLNPLKIVNKWTNEPLIVGCGKCEACLLQKSSMRSLRCKLESASHKYCMFVTLTYDNDSVPLCEAIPYTTKLGGDTPSLANLDVQRVMFVDRTPRLNTEGLIIADTATKLDDLIALDTKVNMNGYFPYLCVRDAQNFIKRLRSHLQTFHSIHIKESKIKHLKDRIYDKSIPSQKTECEKIRYYIAGEYGPVHFRPHYHALIWFDEPETLQYIGQAIHKAWKFGRVDYSLSRGSASSYTSGYINSYCNLPKLYQSPQAKPFSCHSCRLGEEILKKSKEEVYQLQPERFASVSISLDGIVTDVNLWRSLTSFYFPKCSYYSSKSPLERLYSYKIYDVASRWSGESKPCLIAKWITDYISKYGFSYDYVNHRIEFEEIIEFIDYLRSCFPYTDYTLLTDDMLEKVFRIVYREIRTSEHFLNFCCDVKYYPLKMLSIIDNYYKQIDKLNLTKQLKYQEETFNDDTDLDEYIFIYNNVPLNIKDINGTSVYLKHQSNIFQRWNNSIKHKKLNDANGIFNNK